MGGRWPLASPPKTLRPDCHDNGAPMLQQGPVWLGEQEHGQKRLGHGSNSSFASPQICGGSTRKSGLIGPGRQGAMPDNTP